MNFKLDQLFTSPFIHCSIENWEFNKRRILYSLPEDTKNNLSSLYSKNNPAEIGSDNLYTDYYENSKLHKLPNYSNLVVEIIRPYLKQFANITYCPHKELHITSMWYHRYYNNSEFQVHDHGSIGWSSIIYLEFDPNVHEGTLFYSTSGVHNPWHGSLQLNCPKINEGDMIIFPSNILHKSLKNTSNKRRTTISFNMIGGNNSHHIKVNVE